MPIDNQAQSQTLPNMAPPPSPPKRGGGVPGWLIVFLVSFLFSGIAAGAVYVRQQQKVSSLQSDLAQAQEQATTASAEAMRLQSELDTAQEELAAMEGMQEDVEEQSDRITIPSKVYTDEEYGFSFSFPGSWMIDIDSDDQKASRLQQFGATDLLSLQNRTWEAYISDGDLFVTVIAHTSENSLADWFSENNDFTEEKLAENIQMMAIEAPALELSREDIDVSVVEGSNDIGEYIQETVRFSKPGYIEGGAMSHKTYYFLKNGYVYEFTARTATGDQTDNLLAQFDDVISSLRFAN